MISSDYLIMKELKQECLKWLKSHFTQIIIEAFYKDQNDDIPIDQIEDSLMEEICHDINKDPVYISELLSLEGFLG